MHLCAATEPRPPALQHTNAHTRSAATHTHTRTHMHTHAHTHTLRTHTHTHTHHAHTPRTLSAQPALILSWLTRRTLPTDGGARLRWLVPPARAVAARGRPRVGAGGRPAARVDQGAARCVQGARFWLDGHHTQPRAAAHAGRRADAAVRRIQASAPSSERRERAGARERRIDGEERGESDIAGSEMLRAPCRPALAKASPPLAVVRCARNPLTPAARHLPRSQRVRVARPPRRRALPRRRARAAASLQRRRRQPPPCRAQRRRAPRALGGGGRACARCLAHGHAPRRPLP